MMLKHNPTHLLRLIVRCVVQRDNAGRNTIQPVMFHVLN